MVNSDEFQLFEYMYFALPIICRMADYLKTFVCTQDHIWWKITLIVATIMLKYFSQIFFDHQKENFIQDFTNRQSICDFPESMH